ncbi:DUF4041 domain-containing protein [Aerococcaceae bacterium zg-ZJ1578]|nr:DUF4041 domain-containing protein [Aerococcaceae bacterium zg-1578]
MPSTSNEKDTLIFNDIDTKSKSNFISTFKESIIDEKIETKKQLLKELNEKIDEANLALEFIEYGLYERKYKFSDSIQYKEKLDEIRQKEKELIKSDKAGVILVPMTLNNSISRGKTMQKQLIKAMIRGFNGETDSLLNKITVSNSEQKVLSLEKIYEQLNKLYKRNEIQISKSYLELKKEELRLAAEYELMKSEEKELLKEQREKEREDKKLQSEIANRRKQLNKDRKHFKQMISTVQEMITNADEAESEKLKSQLSEYEDKLSELDEIEEDIDYREGHAQAGYVYIISNIGSFGEDIYKIGVTRRLEPLERIRELSSASVPFQFDVHALVFSEQAFALETELHNELERYKINKLNNRKEYFKVPFEKIKEVLNRHKELTIEINEEAEAFEYRQSLLKQQKSSARID